ncbi:myosin regulatory light chain, putative [Eimeria tenella]|uniref:Myosin regulatory light chain, putative n=1 Tax=Eimeria tenella TaxID=5802 RepID=U6L2D5_EIMTE|nr:myosin regulatory light chain, putative [Eimeria tenella]CDJ43358.1 myosin regulatory light chain, putative [Eimeria tenella]|eukprot:XP_013234108.1 myosin regulatory light chain, putative [Eimeria tenella]
MASSRGIKLTEQHLRLMYDTFCLLDEDKDGRIDKGQFFILFRALGQTVSDANLSKIFASALAEEAKNAARAKQAAPKDAAAAAPKKAAGAAAAAAAAPPDADAHAQGTLGFAQFAKTFAERFEPPLAAATLRRAFGVFDAARSGKLSQTQLLEILAKRGEPLRKEELDELLLLAALGHSKETDYALLADRLVKGPAGIATITD